MCYVSYHTNNTSGKFSYYLIICILLMRNKLREILWQWFFITWLVSSSYRIKNHNVSVQRPWTFNAPHSLCFSNWVLMSSTLKSPRDPSLPYWKPYFLLLLFLLFLFILVTGVAMHEGAQVRNFPFSHFCSSLRPLHQSVILLLHPPPQYPSSLPTVTAMAFP